MGAVQSIKEYYTSIFLCNIGSWNNKPKPKRIMVESIKIVDHIMDNACMSWKVDIMIICMKRWNSQKQLRLTLILLTKPLCFPWTKEQQMGSMQGCHTREWHCQRSQGHW